MTILILFFVILLDHASWHRFEEYVSGHLRISIDVQSDFLNASDSNSLRLNSRDDRLLIESELVTWLSPWLEWVTVKCYREWYVIGEDCWFGWSDTFRCTAGHSIVGKNVSFDNHVVGWSTEPTARIVSARVTFNKATTLDDYIGATCGGSWLREDLVDWVGNEESFTGIAKIIIDFWPRVAIESSLSW